MKLRAYLAAVAAVSLLGAWRIAFSFDVLGVVQGCALVVLGGAMVAAALAGVALWTLGRRVKSTVDQVATEWVTERLDEANDDPFSDDPLEALGDDVLGRLLRRAMERDMEAIRADARAAAEEQRGDG